MLVHFLIIAERQSVSRRELIMPTGSEYLVDLDFFEDSKELWFDVCVDALFLIAALADIGPGR